MSVYPRPDDRRCPEEGCITVLCSLNPGPACFAHTKRVELQPDRTGIEAAAFRELVERAETYSQPVAA